MRSQAGVAASYSLSSNYHGAHAGLGYVFKLSESANLDLYGRYFWTRQEGGTAALSTGEAVRFEDADSSRGKAGARVSARLGDAVSVFTGAAWERKMDGEARAFINDLPIEAPSSKGDTAVGKLGFSIKPGSGPLKPGSGHGGARREAPRGVG